MNFTVAQYIFIVTFLVLAYTFLGYPFILMVSSFFINRKVTRGNIEPEVTMIIPVHNEEKLIKKKIENCLDIDYPENKLKIMIVSDCSTDRTEEIIRNYQSDQVQLLSLAERSGKVVAQNKALQCADSEIIVFTDVAIIIQPDAIKRIVQNFYDENVGAVSCRDVIIDGKQKFNGESDYIRYDMLVRKFASRVNTLIGVTGGFFAIRKKLTDGGWQPEFSPDFNAALICIRNGLRVVEDSAVKGFYKTSDDSQDEFRRKVRTFNRGMHALFSNIDMLNPVKYGFVAIALITQKLFRWLSPFFFIILFLANLMVLNENIFMTAILVFQCVIYFLAIVAFFVKPQGRELKILKLPFYFIITNIALLKAWYQYFMGKKYIIWEPTKR